MLRRASALAMIVLAGSLALPARCAACSCLPVRDAERLARADVVFRGRVAEVERTPRWRDLVGWLPLADEPRSATRARFQVEAVWKGPVGAEIVVGGGPGTCAISLMEGNEYLTCARDGGDGAFETDRCLQPTADRDSGDPLAPGTPIAVPTASNQHRGRKHKLAGSRLYGAKPSPRGADRHPYPPVAESSATVDHGRGRIA